jgi:hypothetical protein
MKKVNGILLIYNHPATDSAPTILEHVNAYSKYSKFKIWKINTEFGFPKNLKELEFSVIILHYSLFGIEYSIDAGFQTYIKQSTNYKIAFFQDEHRFCRQRFDFLKEFDVNCVYSLLEPQLSKELYGKYSDVEEVDFNLTGYVDDVLIARAQKYYKPFEERTVDVGYRGRPLDFHAGRGGLEKVEIASKFLNHLDHIKNIDLKVDIRTGEQDRIYGDNWFKFVANCKFMLGVEAGVSIFDVEGNVKAECDPLLSKNPNITFEELSREVLHKYEDNIFYRTISPRIFEAAAFKVCQILYEGKYSGALLPMVHYIPLKKDFSNIGEVLTMMENKEFCSQLTQNAYNDVIASGQYSYESFIKQFDTRLHLLDIIGALDNEVLLEVNSIFKNIDRVHAMKSVFKRFLAIQFPGKKTLKKVISPYFERKNHKSKYRSN